MKQQIPAVPGAGQASIVDLAGALAHQLCSSSTPDAATSLPSRASEAITCGWQQGLVVLLVLDGVGCAQVQRHVPHGALASAMVGELSSVFPSSTAPAITSLLTAAPVGRHANPGWFMVDDAGTQVVRTLPMDYRHDHSLPADPGLWGWQPWAQQLVQPAGVEGFSGAKAVCLQPVEIAHSVYSQRGFAGVDSVGYSGLDDLYRRFERVLDERGSLAHYVYVYIPDYDSASHAHGWQSARAGACLAALDELSASLMALTSGAGGCLLATADHGFTDIEPGNQLNVADWPELANLLSAPVTGEPRAAFCHVAPADRQRFGDLARERLSRYCDVFDSVDLIEAGWFGTEFDPRFAQRVGSYTLVMKPGYAIVDFLPGEARHIMIGMHGGTTPDEIRVPLVVYGGS